MARLVRMIVVLGLVASGTSWPQLSFEGDLEGRSNSLPQIPYTRKRALREPLDSRQLPADDYFDDMALSTLPVPMLSKPSSKRSVDTRQLPEINDMDSSMATLPVPMKATKSSKRVRSRQFPVVDGMEGSMATLPVPVRQPKAVGVRDLPTVSNSPGLVTLPVIRSRKPGLSSRAVEVPLANRSDVAYYAQLNLGNPPQPVFVQLDTGSFELWVNPDCTSLESRGDLRFCEAVGVYDASVSTTASGFSGAKTLRYGIGAANITYVRDDISLPGSSSRLRGVQFGVATSTEDQFAGILGIGYGEGITTGYKNFIDELATQGVTSTRTFSLALGSKSEQEGVIVFGGIDTAKFSGPLARLPIIPPSQAPDGVPRYWVQMNGITLTAPSGVQRMYPNSSLPVFLDSGATLTLLPPLLANAIARDFGATGLDSNGFYAVDCQFIRYEGSIDFSFAGVTIKVPYKEMVREIRVAAGSPNQAPVTMCFLGIVPSDDFALLGDTFLRSAYVVFDAQGNATYLASYQNCGSQLVNIDDISMIPRITGTCSRGIPLAGNPVFGSPNPSVTVSSTISILRSASPMQAWLSATLSVFLLSAFKFSL